MQEEKSMNERIKKAFENVKETCPLVHSITNYVTVNDCANILLAAGASPIMADEPDEVADITRICTSLNINIGTLNTTTVKSMLIAGKTANMLGHPVVLDPVGAGASPLRTETCRTLLEKVHFNVIKGNISEIKTLALGSGAARGVDASALDEITAENITAHIEFIKKFARTTASVTAVTGRLDIVTDGENTAIISNGHPIMSKITGSGCMLSALMGAFAGANPDDAFAGAVTAVIMMGLAGELAEKRTAGAGSGTFRQNLIDEIYNMDYDKLIRGAKYEIA